MCSESGGPAGLRAAGGQDPAEDPTGGNPDPGRLPPLENVGDNTDGIFGFTIPNNLAVDIEYSTDLLRWETIAADVSGTLEETDPDRSNAPSGYYRAIQR